MAGAGVFGWIVWAGILAGLSLQVIGTLLGPPRRIAGPVWLLASGAALLGCAFLAGVVYSAVTGNLVALFQYASALVVVLVLCLIIWQHHVRAAASER